MPQHSPVQRPVRRARRRVLLVEPLEPRLAPAVHAAPDAIEIDCDPERVAQVMRILLDNALVHTPAGTTIVVSAARENGHVTLEVADTGLGIRNQTMPHIFEPFRRGGNVGATRGTGIGLAGARQIVAQHGGTITAESVEGHASTITVRLPLGPQ